MTHLHRRVSFYLVAVLLAALGSVLMLQRSSEPGRDSSISMRAAARHYDSVVVLARAARSDDGLSDEQVISLGYLERLRLGLGSPFRLVDMALHDNRLRDSTRRAVSWALLARLKRGDAFVLNPRTLDGIERVHEPAAASGADHVRFIEHAIASATDPRTGALAVRLAYELASAEGTISAPGAEVAAEAAGLVRDRLLAQEDLHTLFSTARQEQADALSAVMVLRSHGNFEVEQPSARPLSAAQEVSAMRSVPRLLDSLRVLGRAQAASRPRATWPVLGRIAANRLAQLGAEMPPQAPVAVTVRAYRGSLLAPGAGRARARFAAGALNEESLAAEFASLVAHGDSSRIPALAVLTSAAQLRAYAQEVPWFPGSPAPTEVELRNAFGLASVTFEPDVPRLWRPYYLRMLASSIRDMQRVLPALSVAGMRVAFGVDQLPDTALAMHDPATRSIRLSILTSAGTIAHEIAHDLDWQTARRMYPKSGGYSTDHAIRDRSGALGSSVRGLTAARLEGPPGVAVASGSSRPAEFFARDMDWFVSVSLASLGRSNGYLTAVQDAAITGYAAASPNDLVAGAGAALMDAVQQMTYLPRSTRDQFLERWTDPASVDPYVLVRRVADLKVASRPHPRSGWEPLPEVGAGDLALCFAEAYDWSPEVRARQALMDLALDSRASGLVERWARAYTPAQRPAWASSALGIPPWDPAAGERMVARVRTQLAQMLERGVAPGRSVVPSLALFSRPDASCGDE